MGLIPMNWVYLQDLDIRKLMKNAQKWVLIIRSLVNVSQEPDVRNPNANFVV